MAVLSETERQQIWRGVMRWWSNERESVGLSKSDLRAAIDATDNWINSNQSAYNSALPSAAQTNLTQTQKTLLFCVVALARVSIGFLRRVIGEVD